MSLKEIVEERVANFVQNRKGGKKSTILFEKDILLQNKIYFDFSFYESFL